MPVLTLPRVVASWISLAILAGAIYLLWSWGEGEVVLRDDGVPQRLREDWRLYTGLGLLAWSFLGRFVVLAFLPPRRGAGHGLRGDGETINGPGGACLRLDHYGREDAPVLVFTHGWGLNGAAWSPMARRLQDRFHVVTWDLPGLGRSEGLPNGRYSLEEFASALGAVVDSLGGRRVVLIGHSIGGMTTETLWRACPEDLRRRVAGVVLVNTTFHDPLKTMWLSPLWTGLKKPLIEPLNRLAVVFSPLIWLSNWQSYLSGGAHLATRFSGFGRFASREDVELVSRLAAKASPAVQAKGNLAMLAWSASDLLSRLDVPALVIAGGKDIVTLPEASDAMAAAIPGAQLIRVDGVGHMGFMERPEVYDQAIADFAEAAFRGDKDLDGGREAPAAAPTATLH